MQPQAHTPHGGPQRGSLFVAHDYLTGLGKDIVRRDEIRLLEDTDADGYADKSTLYAGGFNSLQGLAYHAGTVYAMHAPLLTALEDTDDDGRADRRRDLLAGLGLPPEENPPRLHCANGLVVGHDGWLYLALGDHGCDVRRGEGDRLVLEGGGILRCRPDGSDLHVFATGLRNIYDVALDEDLNVFVRDNENDGGDYLIRVCHSFFGADHGYPYDYYERPEHALPPLVELGRGSSAGVASYLESAFPAAYRESLYFCEWGRAVVRYPLKREGSRFASVDEVDFAAGAANDPYGFKPTDLVVGRDGSLFVSDWADGQRPKRGRGRIYRIRFTGKRETADVTHELNNSRKTMAIDEWIDQLDSPSYYQRVAAQEALEQRANTALGARSAGPFRERVKHRLPTDPRECSRRHKPHMGAVRRALAKETIGVLGRLHAIWVLAHVAGRDRIGELLEIAESDSDPRVRAQAVRALADLTDPVLVRHRLDAGRGDPMMAARLAKIVDEDPRVMLEVVIALGRLRWHGAPGWLREHFPGNPGRVAQNPDAAVSHAAMQTLRAANNWPAVLKLLDAPEGSHISQLALRAVADQAETAIVDGLIQRLKTETRPHRRAAYADILARVYKQPGDWKYWGYRPAPRPANTITWERTQAIEQALNDALIRRDGGEAKAEILRLMQREQVPVKFSILAGWLKHKPDSQSVAAILDSLAVVARSRERATTRDVGDLLQGVVRRRVYAASNRLAALEILTDPRVSRAGEETLLDLAKHVEPGPVLAAILRGFSEHPQLDTVDFLKRHLTSNTPEVRAAAIDSLAVLKADVAESEIPSLLEDEDVRVRRAAATAAGRLRVRNAADALLKLSRDTDPVSCSAALDSLRQLGDGRAVRSAARALDDPQTQLAALEYLGAFGGPEQGDDVVSLAAHNRSMQTLSGVVRVLSGWHEALPTDSDDAQSLARAIARIQGDSGVFLRYSCTEVPTGDRAARLVAQNSKPLRAADGLTPSGNWQTLLGEGTVGRVQLPAVNQVPAERVWLSYSDVELAEEADVEFFASGDGNLEVWLDGRSLHRRDGPGRFRVDSDRFSVNLGEGAHRLFIQLSPPGNRARFHLRFRRKSSTAEHERLARLALNTRGNAPQGRELFFNTEKVACIKCHRIGEEGGRIGPDLSGVGRRFSRIHLVESILEPSRTVAPSYGTIVLALKDGRIFSGVPVAETARELTLGDKDGKTHVIDKSEIERRAAGTKSTMPDGLEKQLTDRQFVDLIAFLLSQKQTNAAQK